MFGVPGDFAFRVNDVISMDPRFPITGLDVTNRGADAYGHYPIDDSLTFATEIDQNQLGTLLIESVNP